MYVLRAHLRTGLAIESNFEDIATGTAELDALTRARTTGTPVQIMDDAGRQHRFAGTDLLTESLIDIAVEAASILRLGATLTKAATDERQRLGMPAQHQPVQQFEAAPPPRLVFNAGPADSQLLPDQQPRYERANPASHPRFSS